jgi:hypothetical protein
MFHRWNWTRVRTLDRWTRARNGHAGPSPAAPTRARPRFARASPASSARAQGANHRPRSLAKTLFEASRASPFVDTRRVVVVVVVVVVVGRRRR